MLLIGQMPVAKAAPAATITLPTLYNRIDNGSGQYIDANNDTDSGVSPADVCTLRDAFETANTGAGVLGCNVTSVGGVANQSDPWVIFLPTGSYTYTLDGEELYHEESDLYVYGDSPANTIIQASADDPTDGGGEAYRVIESVYNSLHLSDLTVRYGQCDGECGGDFDSDGGGILATEDAPLELDNVVVYHNAADERGGGIYSRDMLSLTDSTLDGNLGGDGGGVYATDDANITRSTFSNNWALTSTGGGLHFSGVEAVIRDSTFSGNTANEYGGGIYYEGEFLYLFNVTITDNEVYNVTTFTGPTFVSYSSGPSALNFVFDGGGIFSDPSGDPPELFNTILAGNTASSEGPDCWGPVDTGGYNLVGDADNCTITPTTGDQFGTGLSPIDPVLGSLANNGGLTQTHALLTGSPAIDGGDPAGCSTGHSISTEDQRRFPRPQDGDNNGSLICDIGAFELQSVVVGVTPTPNFDVTLTASVDPTSANVGDTVFWTFVIHNPGTQDTAGLSFRADLPSNLTYVGLTTTSGALRTPLTLPTIWVDMPNIPAGTSVTIVIETTVDATAFASPPIRARVVAPIVKAARHLLQTASACVQGSVAAVGAQACLTVLPAELPETGGAPVSPLPWIGAVLAAMLLASGGLLLRRRIASE